MKKFLIISTWIILSIVMLTIGIKIGKNLDKKDTIDNVTSYEHLKSLVQQKALNSYNAEIKIPSMNCVLQIEKGYIHDIVFYHQNGNYAINYELDSQHGGVGSGFYQIERYKIGLCYDTDGNEISISDFHNKYPHIIEYMDSITKHSEY